MDDMNLSIGSSGIAELTFDVKDEKVNVLSARVMTELGRMLDEIFENKNIKILMFKSAKRDVFIAGADLREIAGIKNNEDAGEKSAAGQGIFNRIERLPFPTISVINGACLGGGLELALSCSYRIVSDGKKVRLGLPETTLGLIPGFGGTVRLPRLVGLSRGLEMILSGKSVDGLKSYKIKLSDAIYPEAFIDENAEKFAVKIIEDEVFRKNLERKRKKSGGNFLLEGNPAGRALFFYAAKKKLDEKDQRILSGGFDCFRNN